MTQETRLAEGQCLVKGLMGAAEVPVSQTPLGMFKVNEIQTQDFYSQICFFQAEYEAEMMWNLELLQPSCRREGFYRLDKCPKGPCVKGL